MSDLAKGPAKEPGGEPVQGCSAPSPYLGLIVAILIAGVAALLYTVLK